MADPARDLIRHTLATIAYRCGKTIRDAPPGFGAFDGAGRTPLAILAHMGDLFDWCLRTAKGDNSWRGSTPLAWEQEVQRFFNALAAFDAFVVSGEPFQAPVERLLQGPIADSLTHVGQLAMLRRMAGSPMRFENYYLAPVEAGRVKFEP